MSQSIQIVQDETVKMIQTEAKKILRDVAEVLERNNLKYVMLFGSLLGTIRHKGFIPWDDDVDILMTRQDYEKFKSIAKEQLDPKYFVQDVETDEEYPSLVPKVRNSNTTLIERGHIHLRKLNQGIFIDIFVVDKYVDTRLNRFRLFKIRFCESMLLSKGSKFAPSYKRLLARFFSRKRLISSVKRNLQKIQKGKGVKRYTIHYKHETDIAYIENRVKVPFEDIEVYVPAKYDKCLREEFGNYMQLPPEKDRVPKHTTRYVSGEIPYMEYINKYIDKQ